MPTRRIPIRHRAPLPPATAGRMAAEAPYDSLIDLKEVCRRTGIGRTTIKTLLAAGTFPPKVRITPMIVRWSAKGVEQWIQDQIAAAAGPAVPVRPGVPKGCDCDHPGTDPLMHASDCRWRARRSS